MPRFTQSSVRVFATAALIVGVIVFSLKFFRKPKPSPEASALFSATPATASASLLHVQGGWDFFWKDQHGVLLRTHGQILQRGSLVRLQLHDARLMNVDEQRPIEGTVGAAAISFRVDRGEEAPLLFIGTVDNGILHGTTNEGLNWMAMRDLK